MASGGARRISLIVSALAALAHSSWVPRPLSEYSAGDPPEGSRHGVRRFSHHERHVLDDGSDVELQWEVHADPDAILAIDLEHREGMRVVECREDTLLLHVPGKHLQRVATWRHVTASDSLHRCGHLEGMNLYHRIHHVESIVAHKPPSTGALVKLSTEELGSASHVFPHCRFSFTYLPVEARDPDAAEGPERRLGFGFNSGKTTMQNSFKPVESSTNSMVNFNIPKQLSNLSWNWDYHANSTENPQFKYTFPGGEGYMRLYQPYLKAHFGIHINVTSHMKGMMKSPHVQVNGELQGIADFNADVATAMAFKTDHSASVLDNVLDHFGDHFGDLHIPGILKNLTLPKQALTPLKFFMGGTPLTMKPHFTCRMKAYHLGQLKGSLRVGLATKLLLHGTMVFDTDTGLHTNFSARSLDVQFTPPSWMLYTQQFELGIMLEPTVFLKGLMNMKDMELGMGLRPYLNVSIMENSGQTPNQAPLAVYPFRMVGLPTGRNYAVEIRTNDMIVRTVNQISIGMTQFYDNVDDFQFGLVGHDALNTTDIEVIILEDGAEVGRSVTQCISALLGECHPSKMTVPVRVQNSTAVVQMSGYWEPNAVMSIKKKVKSIGVQFNMITVSKEISETLETHHGALDGARLVLRHSGQTFTVPLSKGQLDSTMLLESKMIYELGPIFQDSWKYAGSRQDVKDPLTPVVDIVVLGKVVATGPLPIINWDHQDSFGGMGSIAAGAGSFKASVTTIPVTAPLYPPGDQKTMLGTAKVSFNMMPAGKAAFIITPSQAETYVVGHTYKFRWAVSGTSEKEEQTFYISAKTIASDGTATEINWLVTVHVTCSKGVDVDVNRYLGEDADPCIYEAKITIPDVLGGHRGVVVVNWMDEEVNPYEMISPLVNFVSGRRLDSANADQWGGQSLGETTSNTFGPKVKKKLHKLASHCSSTPLKYAVNAGMNMVEIMKGIMMPGTSMIGSMDKPTTGDWKSSPVPIFMLGGNRSNNHKLSSLLPKEMCDNGVCEGMMPGCQREKVSTENIQQIEFKLSRSFKWKKHVGPKMRHIVAYALAIFPSSLAIGGEQLEEQKRLYEVSTITETTSTVTKTTATATATTATTTVATTVTTATRTTTTLATTTTEAPTTTATTAAAAAAAASSSPAQRQPPASPVGYGYPATPSPAFLAPQDAVPVAKEFVMREEAPAAAATPAPGAAQAAPQSGAAAPYPSAAPPAGSAGPTEHWGAAAQATIAPAAAYAAPVSSTLGPFGSDAYVPPPSAAAQSSVAQPSAAAAAPMAGTLDLASPAASALPQDAAAQGATAPSGAVAGTAAVAPEADAAAQGAVSQSGAAAGTAAVAPGVAGALAYVGTQGAPAQGAVQGAPAQGAVVLPGAVAGTAAAPEAVGTPASAAIQGAAAQGAVAPPGAAAGTASVAAEAAGAYAAAQGTAAAPPVAPAALVASSTLEPTSVAGSALPPEAVTGDAVAPPAATAAPVAVAPEPTGPPAPAREAVVPATTAAPTAASTASTTERATPTSSTEPRAAAASTTAAPGSSSKEEERDVQGSTAAPSPATTTSRAARAASTAGPAGSSRAPRARAAVAATTAAPEALEPASPAGFEWVMPYVTSAPRRLASAAGGGESSPPRHAGRWEAETEDEDEDYLEEKFEFDTFVVRIREPVHYQLTESLLKGLLETGAFRGIEDGREATHGPVGISSFALLPTRGAAAAAPAAARADAAQASAPAELLADAGEALYQRDGPHVATSSGEKADRGHRALPAAAAASAIVASVALFAAFAAVAAAVRRRGYMRLAQRQHAQDVLSQAV